jgi:hypothetical protein
MSTQGFNGPGYELRVDRKYPPNAGVIEVETFKLKAIVLIVGLPCILVSIKISCQQMLFIKNVECYNVYLTPTCFGPSRTIIREYIFVPR